MQSFSNLPRRVAILAHPSLAGATDEALCFESALRERGVFSAIWTSISDETLRRQLQQGEFDLLVALGGDGTMLRAGRLCAPFGIPVLGINLGRFGFLTEVTRTEWPKMLDDLVAGSYRIEERMMLRTEHHRNEQLLGRWEVLNEVVVCRGQFVRPVTLRAYVDGYLLASYVADGLIVATPTGSTAYALAAGGPILPPEQRNILVMPVAPHLSMDRAIILSAAARVKIEVRTSHEAVLSVDGNPPVTMLDGDEVQAATSQYIARYVRFQDPGYFYRNLTSYMEQNPVAGSA